MKTTLDLLLQSCLLRCYLWSALGLALFLGICSMPSYFTASPRNEKCWPVRVGETLRCAIWDALIHLLGFLLAPTLLLFVLIISEASHSVEKIILGVLFLPLFFYMIFCVSGHGVDVLYQTTKSGIKSIEITLMRGIKFEFWPKQA
jgi:hypothetical protein